VLLKNLEYNLGFWGVELKSNICVFGVKIKKLLLKRIH